jgi:hypothetical protein
MAIYLEFLKLDRVLLLNRNSIAEISKVEKGEKKNFFENFISAILRFS